MSPLSERTQQRVRGVAAVTSSPAVWTRSDPADVAVASVLDRSDLLRALALGRPDWHDDAECRDSSVDFTSKAKGERARAFDLCGRCEVRTECLAWAIEIDDRHAILGGTDYAARRVMYRHRRDVAEGADES